MSSTAAQFRRFEKANYSERHSPCSHRLRPSRAPCFAGRSASKTSWKPPSTLQRFVLWSPRAISPSVCQFRHPGRTAQKPLRKPEKRDIANELFEPPAKTRGAYRKHLSRRISLDPIRAGFGVCAPDGQLTRFRFPSEATPDPIDANRGLENRKVLLYGWR